jgi:hypothetical protein
MGLQHEADAAHGSSRTTGFFGRDDHVNLDEVERIGI